MIIVPLPRWHKHAACNGAVPADDPSNPDPFHPKRAGVVAARSVARQYCDHCPVRRRCLDETMTVEARETGRRRAGIYAGLSPSQRAQLASGKKKLCLKCWKLRDPDDTCCAHGDSDSATHVEDQPTHTRPASTVTPKAA